MTPPCFPPKSEAGPIAQFTDVANTLVGKAALTDVANMLVGIAALTDVADTLVGKASHTDIAIIVESFNVVNTLYLK